MGRLPAYPGGSQTPASPRRLFFGLPLFSCLEAVAEALTDRSGRPGKGDATFPKETF